MTCVACGASLPTPLDTFGDRDAPLCQSCHLGFLTEGDDDDQLLFSYEDAGDGWLLKKLTEGGAAFLGGTPGQIVAKVNRQAGKIILFG